MLVSTVYVTRQTTISIVILELPKNEIGSLAPNNDSLGPNTQILSVFSEYLSIPNWKYLIIIHFWLRWPGNDIRV